MLWLISLYLAFGQLYLLHEKNADQKEFQKKIKTGEFQPLIKGWLDISKTERLFLPTERLLELSLTNNCDDAFDLFKNSLREKRNLPLGPLDQSILVQTLDRMIDNCNSPRALHSMKAEKQLWQPNAWDKKQNSVTQELKSLENQGYEIFVNGKPWKIAHINPTKEQMWTALSNSKNPFTAYTNLSEFLNALDSLKDNFLVNGKCGRAEPYQLLPQMAGMTAVFFHKDCVLKTKSSDDNQIFKPSSFSSMYENPDNSALWFTLGAVLVSGVAAYNLRGKHVILRGPSFK